MYAKVCLLLLLLQVVSNIQTIQAEEADTQLLLLTEHSPPSSYLNESGQVAGATTQLLRLLAAELDEEIQIELLPWARAFQFATSQRRTALYQTAFSDERRSQFHWVGPLKVYRLWLYGRADRLVSNSKLTELHRQYIACESRSSRLMNHWQQFGYHSERHMILTVRKEQCIELLLQQRIDLLILSDYHASELQQELIRQGTELVKLASIEDVRLYLAFSLDHPLSYINRWQQALEQSYRDGRMRALYQGVFPEELIKHLETFAHQSAENE